MARAPIATDQEDTGLAGGNATAPGAAGVGDPAPGDVGDDGAAGPGGEAGEAGEEVVCTITRTSDGAYKLYHGDEPEEGASEAEASTGAAGEAAPQGEATGPNAGEATGEAPMEGPGEVGGGEGGGVVYNSVGELLKAVLDCVKDHHEAAGGATEQQAFDGGFAEESGAGSGPAPGRKAMM